MKLNETTLKSWYLITFNDITERPNQILWGIIKEDPSFRGVPGDWVCTSVILNQISDQVFVTKNTRYTVTGPGKSFELSIKALNRLRQGTSPDGLDDTSYVTMDDLERAGLLDDGSRDH